MPATRLVAFISLFTSLLAGCASDRPGWEPEDVFRIVFVSNRDGNDEIYKMAADGSEHIRLTETSYSERHPHWTLEHTRIAYEGAGEIFVMNADGSDQTQLTFTTDSGINADPTWSPDSRRIAFDSRRDGNWEIYVMDADGSNQTRLTNDQAIDGQPVWSRDGQSLAFNSTRDGTTQIYRLTLATGAVAPLTAKPSVHRVSDWSWYNEQLLLDRDTPQGAHGTLRMAPDGSNQAALPIVLPTPAGMAMGHRWGQRWPNDVVCDADGEIFRISNVFDTDSTTVEQLTNFPGDIRNVDPDW